MFRNLTIVATAALVALSTGPALAQDATQAPDSPARGRIGLLEQRVGELESLVTNLAKALETAQANIGLLQVELSATQGDLATAQADIVLLTTQLTTAEGAIAVLEDDPIFDLSTFVSDLANCVTVDVVFRDVDYDGADEALPRVFVEGCNLQIANGTGQTIEAGLGPFPNGLGNLIVGYDEGYAPDAPDFLKRCSSGLYDNQADCESNNQVWALNHKNGSHNLVVGVFNRYPQHAGVVFGIGNTVSDNGATVTGGDLNTASGNFSSVSGGFTNTASGQFSSVSGGFNNIASEYNSSVGGGLYNEANALYASVSGGRRNTASGQFSSISGGWRNTASGEYSSVSGGYQRTAPGEKDWAAGSLWEDD